MCGIAGFTGTGNEDTLRQMIAEVKHRGPDANGVFYDGNAGLSHTRLSILDLRPEGNQPMFSANKKLAITFNGEIYNYLQLKKELAPKYHFTTSTDTEVLLYLYKEYGVEMLDKLNGMFAFAIWDAETQQLFLARDRMGKKPLYYSETSGHFVFGSEIRALLKHPSVKKELNLEAMNQYLTFDYVPAPNSIIKNIYKLKPAHYLVVRDNKIQIKKAYWQYNFKENQSITFSDAVKTLDRLLNTATLSRLMSDVALGVFLSGGLDSSTIAYYAQKNSGQKIKTFSIGFEDKSYDESDYASQVAAKLHTEHHSQVLTPQHTLELIEEIYPLCDEPFADASLIPTYFLSKFTRTQVTVALGGDGSDELQAGYPTFISDRFKKPLSVLPKGMIRLLLNMSNKLLTVSDKNISFDFKVKQFLRGFLGKDHYTHQLWLGSFIPSEKKSLFSNQTYNSIASKSGLEIMDYYFNEAGKDWSDFNTTTWYYYQTYLPDDILVKVDRAGMYNSLEIRAPFLDRTVVEFYNSLPRAFKQKGLNGKYILKKLMEGKLPQHIIDRPKKGFGIPLSNWIRIDLKSQIEDVLLSKDDYFQQHYIQRVLNEHQSGKNNHRKLIWNLYILKRYLKANGF